MLSRQHNTHVMKNHCWLDFFNRMHVAYDTKESKSLYQPIKQAFEPKSSSVSSLKSKDGSVIIKDSGDFKKYIL